MADDYSRSKARRIPETVAYRKYRRSSGHKENTEAGAEKGLLGRMGR
jgi:hypothetical protein